VRRRAVISPAGLEGLGGALRQEHPPRHRSESGVGCIPSHRIDHVLNSPAGPFGGKRDGSAELSSKEAEGTSPSWAEVKK
jgi:hypothetical protein